MAAHHQRVAMTHCTILTSHLCGSSSSKGGHDPLYHLNQSSLWQLIIKFKHYRWHYSNVYTHSLTTPTQLRPSHTTFCRDKWHTETYLRSFMMCAEQVARQRVVEETPSSLFLHCHCHIWPMQLCGWFYLQSGLSMYWHPVVTQWLWCDFLCDLYA